MTIFLHVLVDLVKELSYPLSHFSFIKSYFPVRAENNFGLTFDLLVIFICKYEGLSLTNRSLKNC